MEMFEALSSSTTARDGLTFAAATVDIPRDPAQTTATLRTVYNPSAAGAPLLPFEDNYASLLEFVVRSVGSRRKAERAMLDSAVARPAPPAAAAPRAQAARAPPAVAAHAPAAAAAPRGRAAAAPAPAPAPAPAAAQVLVRRKPGAEAAREQASPQARSAKGDKGDAAGNKRKRHASVGDE